MKIESKNAIKITGNPQREEINLADLAALREAIIDVEIDIETKITAIEVKSGKAAGLKKQLDRYLMSLLRSLLH